MTRTIPAFVASYVLGAIPACKAKVTQSQPEEEAASVGDAARAIDAGAPVVDAMPPTAFRREADRPAKCGDRLDAEPEPSAWPTFRSRTLSDEAVRIATKTVDHHRFDTYETKVGGFVVRYDQDERRQCSNLEIREAGCPGPALRARKNWAGGGLRLREERGTFVLTWIPADPSSETPLVAFRRAAIDAGP